MRRPAKLIATTLALLAGGAAAAPGNHGGLHEWLGIVAKRDGSFHELAGESISRWEFLIRGATAGGTTAATAVSRRAVKIFIDTSRFANTIVVQAGRTDFNRLKRRVAHYTAIAEKQRTGI